MTEPMTWIQRNAGSLSRRFIPLGMVGLLALSACAPDEATEDSPEETEAVSDTEPVEDEEAEEDSAAGEEDAPAEDEAENNDGIPTDTSDISHEDAVDTVTYDLPYEGIDGQMEMGLHGLDVGEEGMLLTVSFVPEYDDSSGPLEFNTLHEAHSDYLLPLVTDRDNFKGYYVPVSPDGEWDVWPEAGWVGGSTQEAWASKIGDRLVDSGQTVVLWAYFPTPEDDIDTVDVAVVPGAPEFKDVEINWGDQQPVSADDDEEEDDVVVLEADLLFAANEWELSDSAGARIAELVEEVPEGASVNVHGHTDSNPVLPQYDFDNDELSENRAQAVADVLEDERPDLDLNVEGFGDSQPAVEEDEEEPSTFAANRRVEIRYGD